MSGSNRQISVMLSFPNDARGAAERVERALTEEWNDETLVDLQVKIHHWLRDPSNPYSEDGPQGSFNESILNEADYVIAVFERELGTEWTSQTHRRTFSSGTIAEVELAISMGKPVRIFALGDATPDRDSQWLDGPVDRQDFLRRELRRLETELNLSIREWVDAEELAGWVRKSFSADIRRGWVALDQSSGRKPTSSPIVITRASRPLELPWTYVDREIEQELQHRWDEGATRVALVGDGGVGKSLVARRVLSDAITATDSRPTVIVFVEPATSATITEAYAAAAVRMGLADPDPTAGAAGSSQRLANEFIGALRVTENPWLVILDNVGLDLADDAVSEDDALAELLRQGLLPPDSSVGRTLITTRQLSNSLKRLTRVVAASAFTEPEALAYLRQHEHFANESDDDLRDLASEVDRLPVALSIVVATMDNEGVSASEWLQRYRAGSLEDLDVSDPDGYPVVLGQVWRVALASAARGEPTAGMVQRAALICAVLAPSGHRADIWVTDAMQDYLWQGAEHPLTESRPWVLRRLHEYSLISLASAPDAASLRWSDQIVSMHRLTARAIQSECSDDQVSECVRACADALDATLSEAPEKIRIDVESLVALMTGRGRQSLSMEDAEGWWPHSVVGDLIGAASAGSVLGLPISQLESALYDLGRPGTFMLASLSYNLAALAVGECDYTTAERLLGVEIDRTLLDDDWDSTVEALLLSRNLALRSVRLFEAVADGDRGRARRLAQEWQNQSMHPLEELQVALQMQSYLGQDHRGMIERAVKTVVAEGDQYCIDAAMGMLSAFSESSSELTELLGDHREAFTSWVCELNKAIENSSIVELEAALGQARARTGIANGYAFSVLVEIVRQRIEAGQVKEAVTAGLAGCEEALRVTMIRQPRSPFTLNVRHHQAYWTEQAGDRVGAISLYEALLPDRVAAQGAAHTETLATLEKLAVALAEVERFGEAAVRHGELAQGRSENPEIGPADPSTLNARHNQAYYTDKAGDRAAAIVLYEALLPDRVAAQGRVHRETLVTLRNLAKALAEEGRFGEAAVRY
ncbi:MAG TPA: ATP-binding protein, partial [Propionicimonas sp.]|nr:ATP-binding protein [Propionicimonas sp.]